MKPVRCWFRNAVSQGLCTLQGSSHTEALSPLSFPIPTSKAKHPRECESVGKILQHGALLAHPNFFKENLKKSDQKVMKVIFDHQSLEDKHWKLETALDNNSGQEMSHLGMGSPRR